MKKRVMAFLAALVLTLTLALPRGAKAVYDEAYKSVVVFLDNTAQDLCGGFIVAVDGNDVYAVTDAHAAINGDPILVFGPVDRTLDNSNSAPAKVVTRSDFGFILVRASLSDAKNLVPATLAPVSAISNGTVVGRLGAFYEGTVIDTTKVLSGSSKVVGLDDGDNSIYSTAAIPDPTEFLWVGGPVVTEDNLVVGISLSTDIAGYDSCTAVASLDNLMEYMEAKGIPFQTSKNSGGVGGTILIVVLCAAAAAGVWFFLKKRGGQGGSVPLNTPQTTASLLVTSGPLSGAQFPLRQGSIVIGRAPDQCAVIFPDGTPGVSRVHCKLDYLGGSCTLTDLGSSNGTFLNGQRLAPNVPMPLAPGSVFFLGSPSNSFVFNMM